MFDEVEKRCLNGRSLDEVYDVFLRFLDFFFLYGLNKLRI